MYIVYENTDQGIRPYSPILLTLEQANTLRDKLNFQEYWPVRHDDVLYVERWHVMLMSDYQKSLRSG